MYIHNPYTLVLMYIYCSTYGKTELPGHVATPRWFHQDALTARSPSSCPAKLILAIHLFLKRPRNSARKGLGKRSGWNGTNIFQKCFIGIIFKSLSDCAKGSIFQVRFPGNYYFWPKELPNYMEVEARNWTGPRQQATPEWAVWAGPSVHPSCNWASVQWSTWFQVQLRLSRVMSLKFIVQVRMLAGD